MRTLQTSLLERRLVLVADDEAAIQDLIVQVVRRLGLVAFPVGDGVEAIIAVEAHGAELVCVVLDITMPGRSGLEVLKEIKKSRPKLPVLVLSMHPEDQFAVRLLKISGSV